MQRANLPQKNYTELDQKGPYVSAVILPEFSYEPVASPTSYIIAEYNLLNTVSIVIGRPLDARLVDNDSFALAVRCQGPGNITLRYVLTPKEDLALLYPEYDGQTIYQDGVLEVWVRSANTTYAQLTSDVTIYTNVVDLLQSGEWDNQEEDPLTLEATLFSEVTTGDTNPFSDPMLLAGFGSGIGTAFPPLLGLPVSTVGLTGIGSPEGVVVASGGEWYYDTAMEQFYYKASGTETNTGWIFVV